MYLLHNITNVNYNTYYRIERHGLLVTIWNVRGIDVVKDLGWLNVCQRRDYVTAVIVYHSTGLQPSYKRDLFTLSRDIATRIISLHVTRPNSCCSSGYFLLFIIILLVFFAHLFLTQF